MTRQIFDSQSGSRSKKLLKTVVENILEIQIMEKFNPDPIGFENVNQFKQNLALNDDEMEKISTLKLNIQYKIKGGHRIARLKGITVIYQLTQLNQFLKYIVTIVRENEEIPQKISFNEMINLKGVVFAVPQYTLYMNGIEIWKRSDNIDKQIAKFFIGKDLSEFVGVGIKELPQDIKVVALSLGPFKLYKSDNQECKGQEITQLIPWSI
ncbi:MAG: hypothetical protein EZS28_024529 [Streblomastix strix]|uniref:Uncharacterized protein n=1 Tax=Streblomastix strix TaxID=222440 RepID=A0A5J4VBV2_9EUKA|nr:MAG: hypothetical protein EZS28_024529 [Streblomastix strix]